MSELLTQLIPTAVVGALSPLPLLVVVTLLMSEHGLAKAAAFGAALTGTFAVIGAILLAVADTDATATEGGSVVTGTIIAVIGVLLVLMALKQLLGAPDPDAAPPKFMAQLDQMAPRRAAVLGLVIALVNVKQLAIFVAGVSEIVSASVSGVEAWIALGILLVLIQSGAILAVAGYAVAPEPAARLLKSFQGWLLRHSRTLGIVLGFGIGAAFVFAGVTQITG